MTEQQVYEDELAQYNALGDYFASTGTAIPIDLPEQAPVPAPAEAVDNVWSDAARAASAATRAAMAASRTASGKEGHLKAAEAHKHASWTHGRLAKGGEWDRDKGVPEGLHHKLMSEEHEATAKKEASWMPTSNSGGWLDVLLANCGGPGSGVPGPCPADKKLSAAIHQHFSHLLRDPSGTGLDKKLFIHKVEQDNKILHIQPVRGQDGHTTHSRVAQTRAAADAFEKDNPSWNVVVRDPEATHNEYLTAEEAVANAQLSLDAVVAKLHADPESSADYGYLYTKGTAAWYVGADGDEPGFQATVELALQRAGFDEVTYIQEQRPDGAWTRVDNDAIDDVTLNMWSDEARAAALEARRASREANKATLKAAQIKAMGYTGEKADAKAIELHQAAATAHVAYIDQHFRSARDAGKLGTPEEVALYTKHYTAANRHKGMAEYHTTNQFCPTGEGGGVDATCSPGSAKGSGTKTDPYRCGADIKLAAKLLADGHHIELAQPDQVATLLDKLDKHIKAGKDVDLCKVSAPGSNLFCQETLGVPRVEMPQMRGTAVPGTYAATKEASKSGKVDLTKEFLAHMREEGVKHEVTEIRASNLRASQNQIVGSRVKQLIDETRAGDRDLREKPIFVTKDNYIVDGHHHWAALVAYKEGKDFKVPVYKLDCDIGKALRMANEFTKKAGLVPKSGTTNAFPGRLWTRGTEAWYMSEDNIDSPGAGKQYLAPLGYTVVCEQTPPPEGEGWHETNPN